MTLTLRAHELPAACGVDPYRSRVSLWLEKTGRLSRDEETDARRAEAMEWGVTLQPIIAGVLEIKTAGERMAGAWAGDTAPVQYTIQTLAYMHLTDLRHGLLACLVGGQRLEVRRVDQDEETLMLMLAAAEEFAGLVASDTPPDPDGSDATTAALARMYGGDPALVCNLTAEDAERVTEYKKIRAAVKAGEVQAEEIAQHLKMRLGDAVVGMHDGAPLVRWSQVTAKRFNQARFKEAEPALYAEFCDPSTYRRFTA